MTSFFHAIPGGTPLMLAGLASTAVNATSWWRDCIIESDMGMHTEVVKRNLMSGVWLFIISEAVLFFGLLWSCVHLGEALGGFCGWGGEVWCGVGVGGVGRECRLSWH
jgi:cytochrome c oxidase subunit 3